MNIRIATIIKYYWDEKPLILLLWIAGIVRLAAVIFAKGWGMMDDHFLVIEIAQSWMDGGNFNHWLPWDHTNEGPTGHTFFYAGLHFLLFSALNFFGIIDPQFKMFLVRLLHAALSMVIVYLGYRISEKLSNRNTARVAGILLALYWFMPWFSVRNLVEMVATPFLFIGTWMLMNASAKKKVYQFLLLAGFITGIAFSIRYQTVIYTGGMGLALLIQKKIRDAIMFGFGYLLAVIVFQGIVDFVIWNQPFAELQEYIRYNLDNAYNYLTGDWYNYSLLLLGIFIFPVCFFILIGFFKNWKKHLLIFLPVLLFFLFHSYFPNKQERFIFTVVPFIIVLGIIGWQKIMDNSAFLKKHSTWIRGGWIFFWILNSILLIFVTTMYSKRARAEAMTYLHKYEDVRSILLENTNGHGVQMVPQYYLGQWIKFFEVTQATPTDQLPEYALSGEVEPRFVLFYLDKNLTERVEAMKEYYPQLEFETMIEPGFVDKVMHWLNPHNKNEEIFIYRNAKYFK